MNSLSHPADTVDTLRELSKAHTSYLLAARRSPLTIERYDHSHRTLCSFVESHPRHVLDAGVLRDWIAGMGALQANTVRSNAARVRTWLAWCVREELIAHNHAERLTVPQKPRRLPRGLTQEQVATLLAEPRVSRPGKRARGVHFVVRDATLLEVLYASGLRVSELSALDLSDVERDGTGVVLRVRHGKGDKERLVPLPERTAAAVDAWVKVRAGFSPSGALFTRLKKTGAMGSRLGVRGIQSILNVNARWALPGVHITVHGLRHSCASHLAEGGMEAFALKEFLGHTNIQTTMIYVHASMRHIKRAYAAAHPLARAA